MRTELILAGAIVVCATLAAANVIHPIVRRPVVSNPGVRIINTGDTRVDNLGNTRVTN